MYAYNNNNNNNNSLITIQYLYRAVSAMEMMKSEDTKVLGYAG